MNRKSKEKKLIGLSAIVLCMAFAILFAAFLANASGETTGVRYEEREAGTEIPTLPGYLFGGWYKGNNENTPVREPKEGELYYAKFVPENVLGIKAQASNNILGDDADAGTNAAIRFVTTLDSTKYEAIGFLIKKGDNEEKEANVTNKVYTSLYQVTDQSGALGKIPEEVSPAIFDEASQYFKTYTIRNIPESAYNVDITVTPYWVTLDGTTVKGIKSIKTVNLGRSWVYVDTQANADAQGEYGTREHPFTTLDSALNAVLLEKGKVTINQGGNIKVPAGFTWKEKEVNDKVRTIMLTGENQAATLDFSAISKLGINDNVTFDNMTLKLAKNIYANGHKFTIEKNTVSGNPTTVIYGGGEGTTVPETNIEIYAGEYKEVWGGGNGGTISGNTHVTIKDANIYNTAKSDQSRVFGSGAKDTVEGDVFVTIGGNFNATHKVAAFDRTGHERYSAIHGAGTGTVKGDTYVKIEDQAKVDHVYGGGATDSEVKGTCHVELKGGTVFSIYGGGKGDNVSGAGKNADTSVIVTGGKVCQIIGANGNSMTGNSYVEISGGIVTRRIYGGCYNDITTSPVPTHHVTGYATVVIKDEEAVKNLTGLDAGITAGSRCETTQADEIGILICNKGAYASVEKELRYGGCDYLVDATTGGTVTADEQMLQITPDNKENLGMVTDKTNNAVTYFKGDGICALPERDDVTSKRIVKIDFSAQNAEAALNNCEARIDGIYYDTLESAAAAAKIRKDVPAVTLRKDVTIEESLTVAKGENITLQSEEGQQYTITGIDAMKANKQALCSVSRDGEFAIQNLVLSNAYQGLHSSGTLNVKNVTIDGCKGTEVVNGAHGIYVDAGNIDANGIVIQNTAAMGINVQGTGSGTVSSLAVSGTNQQGIYVAGTAKVNISDFSVEDTSMVAVRLMGSANVILENTAKPISTDSYGIYISDTSTLHMTNVEVERKTSNANTLVVVGKGSTITMDGTSVVDGKKDLCAGRGVEVQGTFHLNGGTIKNHKVTASTNGAFLPSTASNRNDGAGVYVVAGGNFTMNGGTIEGNETTSAGAGVSLNGTGAVFELKGGTIQNNTANYGAVMAREGDFHMSGGTITGNTAKSNGGGVVVSKGIFTMSGGTISNNTANKTATSGTGTGGGVYMNSTGQIILAESGTGTITENTAATHGGGVHITNGAFTMSGNSISNNATIANDGGGVYVTGGTFTVQGGTISENTAKAAGGGVSVNGANAVFTMTGGTMKKNKGVNGGGVIIRACKSFTMSGGNMEENNATNGNGGAIYLKPGYTFTMSGGEIMNKNSAVKGGAIYLEGAGTVNLQAGTISDNVARQVDGQGGKSICGNGQTSILNITTGFVITDSECLNVKINKE